MQSVQSKESIHFDGNSLQDNRMILPQGKDFVGNSLQIDNVVAL